MYGFTSTFPFQNKNQNTYNDKGQKIGIRRQSHVILRNHFMIEAILDMNGFSSMDEMILSGEALSGGSSRRLKIKGYSEVGRRFGISMTRVRDLFIREWGREIRKLRNYEKNGYYSAIPEGFKDYHLE